MPFFLVFLILIRFQSLLRDQIHKCKGSPVNKAKSDLQGKDPLEGRQALSSPWSVESTRHTSGVLRHKPCKELDPGSAPFHRKCCCNLRANTSQSVSGICRLLASRLRGISVLGKMPLEELYRSTSWQRNRNLAERRSEQNSAESSRFDQNPESTGMHA